MNYTWDEQQDLISFGRSYKNYVDAYNKTLTDLETHGILLREFIWKRDTASKLKLQMIDAVVMGDVERVKASENMLNTFLPKFQYPKSGGAFSNVRGLIPDWTFDPSSLEVHAPTPGVVYTPTPDEVDTQLTTNEEFMAAETESDETVYSTIFPTTALTGSGILGWPIIGGVAALIIVSLLLRKKSKS